MRRFNSDRDNNGNFRGGCVRLRSERRGCGEGAKKLLRFLRRQRKTVTKVGGEERALFRRLRRKVVVNK